MGPKTKTFEFTILELWFLNLFLDPQLLILPESKLGWQLLL